MLEAYVFLKIMAVFVTCSTCSLPKYTKQCVDFVYLGSLGFPSQSSLRSTLFLFEDGTQVLSFYLFTFVLVKLYHFTSAQKLCESMN